MHRRTLFPNTYLHVSLANGPLRRMACPREPAAVVSAVPLLGKMPLAACGVVVGEAKRGVDRFRDGHQVNTHCEQRLTLRRSQTWSSYTVICRTESFAEMGDDSSDEGGYLQHSGR